jgi:hypothetical protein
MRTYELADDPTACRETFVPLMLALVKPAQRAEALLAFRALVHNPQVRLELVLWGVPEPAAMGRPCECCHHPQRIALVAANAGRSGREGLRRPSRHQNQVNPVVTTPEHTPWARNPC